LARVCLENYTNQAKSLTYDVANVNPLIAPSNGSHSCANFPSNMRLIFAFRDRDRVVRPDAMSLSYYDGDIVVFEWRRDTP
jgi:hypothetical protein